jgi:hypothetical protein
MYIPSSNTFKRKMAPTRYLQLTPKKNGDEALRLKEIA